MTVLRRKLLFFDLVLPLLVVIGLTLYFASGNRDLEIERSFFDATSGTWKTGDLPIWKWIYDLGPIPAGIVAIGSVVVFVVGFRWPKPGRFRRASAFLFLVAAVGAGIVTNLILKENWGRPRPREVDVFGGRNPFEQVLTLDPISDGKSFPCGHATMGFFFVAFYFLLRKTHPKVALAALIFGLGFGGLLGVTRMLQGGHFASDVVWAAAVMWFSTVGLFYLLRLHKGVLDSPGDPARRRIPLKIKIFGAVAILSGFAAIMIATPFSEKRDYSVVTKVAPDTPLKISLRILYGDLKIVVGDEFSIKGEAWGHGVPTSKIADWLDEEVDEDGTLKLRYQQRWSGKVSEVDQRLVITIPRDRVRYLKLELEDTQATIELPKTAEGCKLEWKAERSKITGLLEEGASIAANFMDEKLIRNEAGDRLRFFKSIPSSGNSYRLFWTAGEQSELTIRKAGSP